MSFKFSATNWVLRRFFQTICRIDVKELQKIPRSGPFIMVGNHINFLEAPVVACHVDNPMFTGIAKRESWKNPLFNYLFNTWGIIPIDREEISREAFQMATQALKDGKVLAISPEGTRSFTGQMLQGKPGVLALVLRSQAPLIPVGFYGYVHFWDNIKHLRRTDFHVVIGKPFKLKLEGSALPRDARQAATDEIMYKVAELLPEEYRGYYHFEGEINYQYVVEA
jgi:1-acyl-sn-glycerol-3-phosphate acyltransferase